MIGNYTQEASEYIDDLVETDLAEMWGNMDQLGTMANAEQWKAKLESIAQEYLMSSRFALMRILHNRVLCAYRASSLDGVRKASWDEKEGIYADETSFRVQVGQAWITFDDISIGHSEMLSPTEHMNYITYLLEIAGPSPEEDPNLHERIISRAWHDEDSANTLMESMLPHKTAEDPHRYQKAISKIEKENKKRYGTIFTREEALQLGHILHFSLTEIQWYLMRVFDTEDGLRMNHSADLIDAYGFMTDASCLHVTKLKQQYKEISSGVEKQDDLNRSRSWTRRTSDELLENVESWKRYPESMDSMFLEWMKNYASGLDIPSHTARRIYRNLAVYAYKCSIGKALIPSENDILDKLLDIYDVEDDNADIRFYLYEDGKTSNKKCNSVAKLLYRENKERSNSESPDSTHAWSIITTRKDGVLSSSYGAINSSRTRIQSLLIGDEDVEKGDLLYLIWFLFNLSWAESPSDDPSTLYNRIFDLKDAAAALLDSALLPPFYPPHLMEQSMLLSIIHGGKTGTDPGIVYGSILQSVKEFRNREEGSKKHTLQEQIDIVNQYRNGMTLKQCALVNDISEKTLSQWQKELIAQGYIPATKE